MGSTPTAAGPVRRRRADAERSIARIVAAARAELGRDPGVGLDDIARAAGVGRMTLYGHFPSRADFVEAVLVDALGAGEEVLSTVDLSGDAREAMRRLVTTSWSLLAESVGLLAAADGVVPAERRREMHDRPAMRISTLIGRGPSSSRPIVTTALAPRIAAQATQRRSNAGRRGSRLRRPAR